MRYEHVSIDCVTHVDAPVRLPSTEIVRRLRPASQRLGIPTDVLLEQVAGIRERRRWNPGTRVADAAIMAAEKALAASHAGLDGIGFRAELASLTLGSGAAAMVLGHRRRLPHGHPFRGD